MGANQKLNPDVYYTVYLSQGRKRSVRAVIESCGLLGIPKPAQRTMEKWAGRYNWKSRAQEFDENVGAETERNTADIVVEMNARQSRLGLTLTQLAQQRADKAIKDDEIIPLDKIVDYAKAGTYIERLGRGAATSRSEITVEFVNSLAPAIAALFLSINMIEVPEARAIQFAEGLNEINRRFVIGAG